MAEETILQELFNLCSIESSLVQIRTMTVSRHEASMRFLEIREGQGDARPLSRVAFYPYFSAVIFDDLMRDGQS